MNSAQASKKAAGVAAAALVEDGMKLGLGTGSTVTFFLSALARRMEKEGITVRGVPTSEQTEREAAKLGIPVGDLDQIPKLDLVIDGADEIDPQFRLIKGGGGALLREKIVAAAGREVVIIVGEGKRVERLGTTFLLPIEVIPFGSRVTGTRIQEAAKCQPFLRTGEDGRPRLTDNGNYIFDCKFPKGITGADRLHRTLSQIPGVVELGLFLNLCHRVIEGHVDGTATTSIAPRPSEK